MSALQAVENYLAELSFLTVAQNENAYVNPTAIVQDLQQAVIGEINEDQLGTAPLMTPGRQTCAGLKSDRADREHLAHSVQAWCPPSSSPARTPSFDFSRNRSCFRCPPPVLHTRVCTPSVMLTCTFQDKKFVKTKENMLIFLDEFITLLGKRVQDYALDIKVKLLSCNAFELSAEPVASPSFLSSLSLLSLPANMPQRVSSGAIQHGEAGHIQSHHQANQAQAPHPRRRQAWCEGHVRNVH